MLVKFHVQILSLTLWLLSLTVGFTQSTAMTFNIRYANPDDGENAWKHRKTAVIDLIKRNRPDLLGLQEVLPEQLDFFRKNLEGYDFIGHGRDGVNTNSEATPVFYNSSKYELLEEEIFWLSETPGEVSIGWDAALNRIAVYGKFKNKQSETIIHLINTHFDHIGSTARLRSAELLIEYMHQKVLTDEKFILMGDLNTPPNEAPIRRLKEELSDSRAIASEVIKGSEATFNGFDPGQAATNRIDYIFVKNLPVKKYHCPDNKRKNGLYPSDHFPVYIVF